MYGFVAKHGGDGAEGQCGASLAAAGISLLGRTSPFYVFLPSRAARSIITLLQLVVITAATPFLPTTG